MNVISSQFELSWVAPFSLDLTYIDPDVISCIQVINITCGNRTTLFSNCTIVGTKLNLFGYSQNHVYEVVVTPRNNVEGANNGTTLVTRGLLGFSFLP